VNIDLGSPVIDVAIGLSFVFFLLSVIASAISEFFAGVLKLRGKTLLKGIKGMVGDVEIAAKVFEHPLVRTDGTKKTQRQMEEGDEKVTWLAKLLKIEHKPSYVSAENFARALLAVAKEHPKRTEPATAGAPDSDFLWKQLEALGITRPPGQRRQRYRHGRKMVQRLDGTGQWLVQTQVPVRDDRDRDRRRGRL
jgi:hypothetical protein